MTEMLEPRPNYRHACCVCGQKPIVDLYKDGKLVDSTNMCGTCTFGEGECSDPENW